MNTHFSPGQVARLCLVARSTVQRWMSDGRLPSVSLPSGHRRVTRAALLTFMKEYHLPIPDALTPEDRVCLLWSGDSLLSERVGRQLNEANCQFEVAQDFYQACLLTGLLEPDVILLEDRQKSRWPLLIKALKDIMPDDVMPALMFLSQADNGLPENLIRGLACASVSPDDQQLPDRLRELTRV